MWTDKYKHVLIDLDPVEHQILHWFTSPKSRKTSLYIHGCTGSGKTQLIMKVILGAYIAEPEQINGPINSTHIPIFQVDFTDQDFILPNYINPGQIFEALDVPPKHIRAKFDQFFIYITTTGCGPTWSRLEEFVNKVILADLYINPPFVQISHPPISNHRVGDVRAEMIRIEFDLLNSNPNAKFTSNPDVQSQSSTKSTRMTEMLGNIPFQSEDDRHIFDMYGTMYLHYPTTIQFLSQFDFKLEAEQPEYINACYAAFIKNAKHRTGEMPYVPFCIAKPPIGNAKWNIDPIVPFDILQFVGYWNQPDRWGEVKAAQMTKEQITQLIRMDKKKVNIKNVLEMKQFNLWSKYLKSGTCAPRTPGH